MSRYIRHNVDVDFSYEEMRWVNDIVEEVEDRGEEESKKARKN